MPSKTAKPWKMASFDVKQFAGKNIEISFSAHTPASTEIHLLMERKINTPAQQKQTTLWAITNDTRRQTIQLR